MARLLQTVYPSELLGTERLLNDAMNVSVLVTVRTYVIKGMDSVQKMFKIQVLNFASSHLHLYKLIWKVSSRGGIC